MRENACCIKFEIKRYGIQTLESGVHCDVCKMSDIVLTLEETFSFIKSLLIKVACYLNKEPSFQRLF